MQDTQPSYKAIYESASILLRQAICLFHYGSSQRIHIVLSSHHEADHIMGYYYPIDVAYDRPRGVCRQLDCHDLE